MPAEFPGWVTAAEAVERYGIAYMMIRKLVQNGTFTRGVFGTGTSRPPIFLRTVELDAWKSGGVTAVAPLKEAFEKTSRELESAGK